MDEQTFKRRTKEFGLAVIRLTDTLPRSRSTDVIVKQLPRCGTSVGANYRAACRGRSISDVIAKLGIVEEEGDESIYWLELLADSGNVRSEQIIELVREADEIVAMTVASIKTLRAKGRISEARAGNPKSRI